MSSALEGDTADPAPRPGLRERKKARTRAAVQEQALRLFREQGYEATTVEQIADAAEISPSTFFRYFPSKEDVVLYDPFDPMLIEAFLAQPPELSPIGALRAAMRELLSHAGTEFMGTQLERADLILSVPDLRRGMLDEFVRSLEPFAEALGRRVGRPATDFELRNLVAAVIGVGLFAWLGTSPDSIPEYIERLDAALAHLEAGLPL